MKTHISLFISILLLINTVAGITQEKNFEFGIYELADQNESGNPDIIKLKVKSFDDDSSPSIVSVKKKAAIGIEDVSKAVSSGHAIELRFNYKGARKFAKLTEDNTGSMIAFVINGEIWSMPRVNAPIKVGVALIQGIKDRELADKTAILINKAIEELK